MIPIVIQTKVLGGSSDGGREFWCLCIVGGERLDLDLDSVGIRCICVSLWVVCFSSKENVESDTSVRVDSELSQSVVVCFGWYDDTLVLGIDRVVLFRVVRFSLSTTSTVELLYFGF